MMTNKEIKQFIQDIESCNVSRKKMVQVHNGIFHADDVLFVVLVAIENGVNPINGLDIIRSRDIDPNFTDIIIGDIGRIYDPKKEMYDHHQTDCPVYDNGIKYASCGLYLKHMKAIPEEFKEPLLERALYAVQAQDNGQRYDMERYRNPFTFISELNACFDEPDGVYSSKQNTYFKNAVIMTLKILTNIIKKIASEMMAKATILSLIKRRTKKYIVMQSALPWKETVIDYNDSEDIVDKVTAVVFPSGKQWNLQVVSKSMTTFESWVSIPASVEKIKGFVFRHKNAFLAAFLSKESAIEAAEMTCYV